MPLLQNFHDFYWFLEFSRCACGILWNLVESCGIHFQILCDLTKTTLTTFLFAWCARSFQCQCSRNSASDPSHGWRAWNSILSMLRYSAWTMLTQAVPQKLGVFLFQSEFQSVSVSSDVTFDSAPSWRLLGAPRPDASIGPHITPVLDWGWQAWQKML